jgi:hypothetical protein
MTKKEEEVVGRYVCPREGRVHPLHPIRFLPRDASSFDGRSSIRFDIRRHLRIIREGFLEHERRDS